METKEEILERLAECRASYEGELDCDETYMLLENTMVALQDLLYLEKVDWREFNGL